MPLKNVEFTKTTGLWVCVALHILLFTYINALFPLEVKHITTFFLFTVIPSGFEIS